MEWHWRKRVNLKISLENQALKYKTCAPLPASCFFIVLKGCIDDGPHSRNNNFGG